MADSGNYNAAAEIKMPEQKAYIADRIFTGNEWLEQHAVVTDNGVIQQVIPSSHLPTSIPIETFAGCCIVPAFIDLQIYGAYGKLLAVYPEPNSLYQLKEYCEKGGAAYCMPTVATNTKEVFCKCIDAVKAYWQQQWKGILGLHLEGPWINSVKRGAHIESLIHSPSLSEVKQLLDYGKDVIKIITLAPEICSKEILELILSYNIIISAGHSNATYKQAKESFGNGITAVTHLFNAMSPLQHREPGLVGAVMDDNKVFSSIIPDGYHVDFAAIRIAKQVMKQRLFVITDAVTETTDGEYQHYKTGDKYEAAGILSGSALNMSTALQNLVTKAGIQTGEAIRMCSLYPAEVIGKHHDLGRIEKGYSSDLVVLNDSLEVQQLIR
ncbi:MAG TPA: N-acetylglucosamine-6-phosphate deacetylase [Chitinophagaceae bacterium]